MRLAEMSSGEALAILENLYHRLNRPEFVAPDPLELVLDAEVADREIVGLIAGSLAVGRANLIVEAGRDILDIISEGKNRDYAAELNKKTLADLRELLENFKYRFYSGDDIALFLHGINLMIQEYGSVGDFAAKSLAQKRSSVNLGQSFYDFFNKVFENDCGVSHGCKHLIPNPEKGSSLKRLNLYFRWMCRQDNLDTGVWDFGSDFLTIPLDVHMLSLSNLMGITKSKVANMKTAVEITNFYAGLNREDPVKWDFSLTRLGIHPDLTYQDLIENKNILEEAI
ncbi:MAG: TIGR02757 family protein [Spirochaetales bacterium]|nr:TIGR02757 family protein [Spirochaetales bacterium]